MISEDVGESSKKSVLELVILFGGRGKFYAVVEQINVIGHKQPLGSTLRYLSHDGFLDRSDQRILGIVKDINWLSVLHS